MPVKVIVISGANRGLGLEFVRQLTGFTSPPLDLLTLEQECDEYHVIALTRKPDDPAFDEIRSTINLLNTKSHDMNNQQYIRRELIILPCDVCKQEDIDTITAFITTTYGRIDLFISNAGVIEQDPHTTVSSLENINDVDMNTIMKVNAFAPVILTNKFSKLLLNANKIITKQLSINNLIFDQHHQSSSTPEQMNKNKSNNDVTSDDGDEDDDEDDDNNIIFDSTIDSGIDITKLDQTKQIKQHVQCIYISSDLGSISRINSPLCPTYRASKAALNTFIRTLSFQFPKINFLSLSPGWVQTDMGSRGGRSPPLTPSESVNGLLEQTNSLRFRQASGHAMYSHQGQEIPW
jgi:NAD(P)-dependent dehydrogenase (short-subunit alcohol dehydrogenase family)